MIARARWRITLPQLQLVQRAVHRAATSAANSTPAETPDGAGNGTGSSVQEPYGQEYGAGPSRLPYEPPIPSSTDSAEPVAAADSATAARLSRTTTRHSARWLRTALKGLSPQQLRGIQKEMSRDKAEQLLALLGVKVDKMSRLELHTLLHDLIRLRCTSLAVWIGIEVLERLQPSCVPRRVFASPTLSALGSLGDGIKVPRRKPWDHSLDPLVQPTIEEQRPRDVSPHLRSFLDLLELLQRVRHPRPQSLYRLIMTQCVKEGRPDEAAKVYVGLVEEWIVEGRIAEGADPSDFYAGGGPPRERKRDSPLLKLWFYGVRTWCLPGEAMSPHDRLDLWHPHHQSLHERLRGFPMPIPTSPPSLVPHPSLQLLSLILNDLAIDPRKASPAQYASAVRALAMLANTVISRTLPVPAVPNMLKAFSDSHMEPAVYPESFVEAPETNAWAYTANTQVHVALVSLMFSPPNYARAAAIERHFSVDTGRPKISIDTDIPMKRGPWRYKLRPLGWKSCLVLIKYAARTLHQPRLLSRLLDYMKVTFKEWDTGTLNILFRGATLSRDNELANAIEDKLFGDSLLAAPDRVVAKSPPVKPLPPPKQSQKQPELEFRPDTVTALIEGIDTEAVNADAYSLAALISHLTATSQFDRLILVVYTLLPYLAVNKETPPEVVKRLAEVSGATVGQDGRIRPTEFPPQILSALMNGLAKSGNTGLAQRIFKLARSFENRAFSNAKQEGLLQRRQQRMSKNEEPWWDSRARKIERHRSPDEEQVGASPLAAHYTIPIQAFTSLIHVYANEARPRPNIMEQMPQGWKPLRKDLELLPRRQAGMLLSWATYVEAVKRWRQSLLVVQEAQEAWRNGHDVPIHITPEQLAARTPDARFFAAIIGVNHKRWGLDHHDPLGRRAAAEVRRVCRDMVDSGVPVPPGLASKFMTGELEGEVFPEYENTKSIGRARNPRRGVFRPTRIAMRDEWGGEGAGKWGLKQTVGVAPTTWGPKQAIGLGLGLGMGEASWEPKLALEGGEAVQQGEEEAEERRGVGVGITQS